MLKKLSCFGVYAISLLHVAFSSPSGAPTAACSTMLPNHGVGAQTTDSPYKIVVSSKNIKNDDYLDVKIESVNEVDQFRGFILRALNRDDKVIGMFSASPAATYKILNCSQITESSAWSFVTHANNQDKNSLSFQWRAPADFTGDIRFKATVVKVKEVFWSNVESEIVSVNASDNNFDIASIYAGCGTSKYCFGYPDNCVEMKKCDFIGAVTVKNGRYFFELLSTIKSVAFIALALSDDGKMGGDSAIECVNEQGVIKPYASLTFVNGSYGAVRENVDQNIATLVTSSTVDGSIYCEVERHATVQVDKIEFDLTKSKFYLLLASGNQLRDGSIGFHDLIFTPTKYATLFVEGKGDIFSGIVPSKNLLFLHALFMVLAWLLFSVIGITSAKFGKTQLQGYQLFGKDLWFVIHQGCMSTVWLLVISSVAIIWTDLGTWKTSAHSVVGIISSVLCVIHPIAAIARPSPTHENRPIFNFIHGSVGKFAQLFAVIAIFIASTFSRANLQDWFKYVLISYVTVYLVTYAVLEVLQIRDKIEWITKAKKTSSSESSIIIVILLLLIVAFVAVLITGLSSAILS